MGLISIASAKGSPGATTTALLFGALWPRECVMAECDPAGGDVAWRMPGSSGEPLDSQQGLLSLAAAGRKELHTGLLPVHSQQIVGGLDVVVGVSVPEQATGLRWDELARLFSEAPGRDVIADLGRIGATTPQNALLDRAAANVFVVDTLPSNVVHLRERLTRLRDKAAAGTAAPVHVVVLSPPKRERAVRETREALERAEIQVAGVHHLAHDPAGADFFLGQVRGRPDRTALVRSGRAIVAEIAEQTQRHFRERPEAAAATVEESA